MATRFITGFDDHNAAHFNADGWVVPAGCNTPTITTGRTGNCLRSAANSGQVVQITATPEGVATIVVCFALRCSGLPSTHRPFVGLASAGVVHFLLGVNPTGTLTAARGLFPPSGNGYNYGSAYLGSPGTTVLVPNVWYWMGLKVTIDDTAGTVLVTVNGVTDINLSSQDTRQGDVAAVTTVALGCAAGDGINFDFDDVHILDTSGSVMNDVIVDSRVDYHLANANGTTRTWTPSTGSDDYAVIDDNPPTDDTDYLSTGTTNNVFTANVENFKNSGGTINSVQVNLLTRKSDAGTCDIAPVVRSGSSDYVGTTKSPSTTYTYQRQNYDTDPEPTHGGAWTESNFNAVEVGAKKIA